MFLDKGGCSRKSVVFSLSKKVDFRGSLVTASQ